MRVFLTWAICVFAALSSGCASVETAKADLGTGVARTYASPYEVVWEAALKALPDLGISVSSADKAANTIAGSKGVSAFSWGERVALRITREGDDQTRVEVVSKRAAVLNITASDWTQDILQQIGNVLLRRTGSASPSLQGNAIRGFSEYEQKPSPKAFAIADGGHWGGVWGRKSLTKEAVAVEAVERCTKAGFTNCRLYAMNAEIIEPQ